jgi:hypothetical protein
MTPSSSPVLSSVFTSSSALTMPLSGDHKANRVLTAGSRARMKHTVDNLEAGGAVLGAAALPHLELLNLCSSCATTAPGGSRSGRRIRKAAAPSAHRRAGVPAG